jgi:Xaa-Pro aminopeptidase
MKTDFGEFLQFETLTLCPIDLTPIVITMMTEEEIQWLNDYHQTVYNRLSPYLNEKETEWLRHACRPL